ncbi:hypothetical protein EJB05_50421, partial [Eragrostis curvula]
MAAYFRYLSTTQARWYLHVASSDVSLAINLVRRDRSASEQRRRPLLPDGGKLKAALAVAAAQAGHPAPDVLARLMTAQYPMFVAGHCYGAMDRPVSNILLSAVWYDVAFGAMNVQGPPQQQEGGLLSARPMSRMVSRSLDGRVAMWLPTLLQVGAPGTQPHHRLRPAVYEYDLSSRSAKRGSPTPLHICPIGDDPPTYWLTGQYSVLRGQAQLCLPSFHSTNKTKQRKFSVHDRYARYCRHHPWEPSYQVDIICGAEAHSKTGYGPRCYHVNFLASTNNDDRTLPRERTLFFAELWESPSSYHQHVPAQPSICCPVSDYFANTGRCSFCEQGASMIVHPPSGGHSGTIQGLADALYRSAVQVANAALFPRIGGFRQDVF